MDKEAYKEIVKKNQVRTNWLKEGGLAFLGGGLLGVIAQGLIDFYAQVLHVETELAFSLSSITLVALASLLTMIGVYNNLGQIFGAGLFIPITGFGNSMVSEGVEGHSEGLIYGIGARTFSLAGSVIVYGLGSSFVCCVVYYILYVAGVIR